MIMLNELEIEAIQSIISKDKWSQLVDDHRDDKGLAAHFGISQEELTRIRDKFDLP